MRTCDKCKYSTLDQGEMSVHWIGREPARKKEKKDKKIYAANNKLLWF